MDSMKGLAAILGATVLMASALACGNGAELTSPPPALLIVDGGEQTAKLGTNCWFTGGRGLCADHAGIPTPVEALEVPAGSFPTLVLRGLTSDSSVRMQIFRVDEIEEITLDEGGSSREWAPRRRGGFRELRSALSQEFPLDLAPGEYVLNVHASWSGLGSANYGFLVRVPSTPASPATPAVMSSIAPNLRLTFAGVEYTGVEILGTASTTGPIICCGTPINMDDMEGIGTGAEHNADVDTTVQIYRPKAGGTTDVYTFHPAQTPGTTPATWIRWTAATLSGVHLTLSAEHAPGQPLTVNLVAEIVGGPDNNRDLYCHGWGFTFGDGGVSRQRGPASCFPTPDSTFPRRFETSHTYEMPGTYEIRFSYGLLKSKSISVEVRTEGMAIVTPAPTPTLTPTPTPTPMSLSPEEGANTQGWMMQLFSGFNVSYPESWIDGEAADLDFQKRSVDPHLSVGPYLELRGLSQEASPLTSLEELVAWAIEGLEEGSDPFWLLTYHEIFGRAREVKVADRASLLGSVSDPGTGEERVGVGARTIEYLVKWPEGSQYRAKLLVIHGGDRVFLVQVFGQQEPFSTYEEDMDAILCSFTVVLEDGQIPDALAGLCPEGGLAHQLQMPVFADPSWANHPWFVPSPTPVASPVSGRIAFLSTRDGYCEIYVINADGTGPVDIDSQTSFTVDRPSFS